MQRSRPCCILVLLYCSDWAFLLLCDFVIFRLESSKLFPPSFSKKVDLRKVNLEVMKPWVESKTQELLGFEDEVVVEYVMGMLESEENQPVSKRSP